MIRKVLLNLIATSESTFVRANQTLGKGFVYLEDLNLLVV